MIPIGLAQKRLAPGQTLRRLVDLSIHTKLILAFFSVTVLAVGTLGYFGGLATQANLLSKLGTNLKSQAVAQGLSIGELLGQQVLALEAFSMNNLVEDGVLQMSASYPADSASVQASIQALNSQWLAAQDNDPLIQSRLSGPINGDIRQYLAAFPENVDMLVTDKYGVVLAASRRPSSLLQAREPWWQAAWNNDQGNFYIGQPIVDAASNRIVVKLALPIRDDQTHQLIGVMAVSYGLGDLSELVDKIQVGATGQAWLAFSDGQILDRGGDQFRAFSPQAFTAIQAATQDYIELPMGSIPSLLVQAPVIGLNPTDPLDALVSNLRWRILTTQDAAESAQPLATTVQIWLIMLGSILLATVLAALLARGFSRPISQLTAAAKQITAGNLSQRVAVSRQDEIGQLATSFNFMAEAVQQRDTELTGLSESLTMRVEERTAALQTANQTLLQQIDEREQAEEALRKSDEQLQQITDTMLDIVCQTDATGIIEYASRSCREVIGYRPEALIGRSIYAGVHPDDLERVRDAVQNTGNVVCRYRHANGQYLWLETLSSLLLSEQGVLRGLVFASRDITLRKEAEDGLRALNQLKTDFLSTAAHELRTPLTSIRGFSEILLTRTVSAARQKRYMSLINEQSTRLGQLIDDLLDISRLEAKHGLALELAPLDFFLLVQKAVLLFAESASGHQISLEGLADDYPLLVGDAFRLQQVLNNLLSNAVKYSPDGGKIVVRCRALSGKLELSVRDEGMGMTPEQLTHLFEKFYRANAGNTAIIGTGLGLTITREIIELHGGKVWVESEYGAGTTVYFTLPLPLLAPPYNETVE